LLLVAGDLVDSASLALQHTLTTDPVVTGALADGTAYLMVRAGTQLELRAFSTADGARRWSSPVSQCLQPVATASGVFCGTDLGVVHFSRNQGSSRTVGAPMAVASLIGLGERVMALSKSQSVQVLSAATGARLGGLELPEQPVNGLLRSPLVRAGTLACGVSPNNKTTTLMCVDATPKLVFRSELQVPQGTLRQANENLLVVSSWRDEPAACEVLSTSTGARLARANSACAAAFSQGNAVSLLTVEPKLRRLDAKGAVQWEQAASWREAARVVQVGSLLIVANYSPIATGTTLFALDVTTGKPAWTADVDSLPIEHSKYANQVELELTERGLLLRGHESSQEFAQLFDVTSGKRLGSAVRRR
jgi:outer membrane protein assembly factor BamB